MGRPSKQTVDYFPHDCEGKKTIFTLESLYGNDGYAFWFKLLELLGSSDGHFYDLNKIPDRLYLFSRAKVSQEVGGQILETLAELEAICPELYKENIVWSGNFVERLRGVYDKRKTTMPVKPSFRPENPSNRGNNPQSKGKESKEEKKKTYGHFKNVLLSPEEYEKLTAKFNGTLESRIESLSEYMKSKGKRYKDHYATILAWARKDEKENPGPGPGPKTVNSADETRAMLERIKNEAKG